MLSHQLYLWLDPHPYRLVGQIELVRVWSRWLTNHGSCILLLALVYSNIIHLLLDWSANSVKRDDWWTKTGVKWYSIGSWYCISRLTECQWLQDKRPMQEKCIIPFESATCPCLPVIDLLNYYFLTCSKIATWFAWYLKSHWVLAHLVSLFSLHGARARACIWDRLDYI